MPQDVVSRQGFYLYTVQELTRSRFGKSANVGLWTEKTEQKQRTTKLRQARSRQFRPIVRKKIYPNHHRGLHKTHGGQTALLAATYGSEEADSGRLGD